MGCPLTVAARGHILKHLDAHGIREAVLTDSVPRAFGKPLACVCTGSVSVGFGNVASDIDVFVVVETDDVQQVPLTNFVDDALIDVRFFSRDAVGGWMDRLASIWGPRLVPCRHDDLVRGRMALENASRFVLGWQFHDGGLDLRDLLPVDAVQDSVVSFWLAEAERNIFAARCGGRHDRRTLERHRYVEAGLALYEAVCAASGDFYFGPKWIGQKVERLDLPDEAWSLSQLLAPDLPLDELRSTVGEIRQWSSATHALVPPETVDVLVADDVEFVDVLGRAMMTRWGIRGRWFDEVSAPQAGDPRAELAGTEQGTVLWSGPSIAEPPPIVDAILLDDFAWVDARRPE